MILYHGTTLKSAQNICLYGIDFSKSQKYLDFGPGFYTTPDIQFATKTAIRKANKNNNKNNKLNDTPAIVIINCDFKNINDLRIKIFEKADEEWASFILANRVNDAVFNNFTFTDNNRNSIYDLIYGEIADTNIINILRQINTGKVKIRQINPDDLRPKTYKYGLQYSFHTKRSLRYITKLQYQNI